jgi:predicted O-methyltransferase YrrM
MNFLLHASIRYIRYFLKAKSAHGIHSPFVFSLVKEVISDRTPFYFFGPVEILRCQLLRDKRMIRVTDYGAGSQKRSSPERSVAEIAKHSAKSQKYGQLLFRLVNYFKPASIIELGTSLGISALYLAGPSSSIRIITLEGCPETAAVAKENFRKLKAQNIEVVAGNFDETLHSALLKTGKADFVFFDGNHRKEPTLRYFRQCLARAHNDSVFVFDDIHWSGEMEEAWNVIKKDPAVTVTIDLFQLGIVFFRKEQAKEDFVVRF